MKLLFGLVLRGANGVLPEQDGAVKWPGHNTLLTELIDETGIMRLGRFLSHTCAVAVPELILEAGAGAAI